MTRPDPTVDHDGFDARLRAGVQRAVERGPAAPTWDDVRAARPPVSRGPMLIAAVVFLLVVLAAAVIQGKGDGDDGIARVPDANGTVPLEVGSSFTIDLIPVPDPLLIGVGKQREWTDATGVWTGSEYLLWGGWRNGAPRNDGVAYNPMTNAWRDLPAAPIAGRWNHQAVWTGREMLVYGGDFEWMGASRSIEGAAYDPVTNTWRRIADAPVEAAPWTFGKALWFDNRLVVALTPDRSSAAAPYGSRPVLAYDTRTDTWTQIHVPGLRDLAATSSGLVGVAPGPDGGQAGLVRIDLATLSVEPLATAPWGRNSSISHVTSDGRHAIAVGYTSADIPQPVGWFDLASRTWTRSFSLPSDRGPTSTPPWVPTDGPDIRWIGGRLAILGDGRLDLIDPVTGVINEGWYLDTRRCMIVNASTVWTGQEWFSFGSPGTCDEVAPASVARFHPGAPR